jgi:DNA-binding GntR family transcriptional regulator
MPTPSLTEKAHAKILRMIDAGKLSPGEKISEKQLAESLSIGRTPVREAIRLMVSQGIMEQLPRYGTFVKKHELRDIVELYEVREAIESFAVYNATPKLDAQDLAVLQKLFQIVEDLAKQVKLDPNKANDPKLTARLVGADQSFHLYLIHAAGNRRIMNILTDTQVIARAFMGKVAQQNAKMIALTYRDHKALWQALKKKDAATARDLMIRHIRESQQQAVDYFERSQANRTSAPEIDQLIENLT